MAALHFKKNKKSKKKGEDSGVYDVRLHKAQDAHAVKKLLLKVEDHNALDVNGDTPLHSYIRRKDKEKFNCLMTFLIHSKCDVNLPNREGQTALHLACEAGDDKLIKALIAFDAKLNKVNNQYFTPLDIVLENSSDSELKDHLIQLGAMTAEELGVTDDDDSFGSGRVSPYFEVDLMSRQLIDGQPLSEDFNNRPVSLAVKVNGHGRRRYREEVEFDGEESPSPPRLQGRSPTPSPPLPLAATGDVGLTGVPEELEDESDDPLFMTAWQFQDPLFMTAREHVDFDTPETSVEDSNTKLQLINDSSSNNMEKDATTEPVSTEASGVKKGATELKLHVPVDGVSTTKKDHSISPASPESSLVMELSSPISPTSSIEMGLSYRQLQYLVNQKQNREESISTIASLSSVLRTPFLNDTDSLLQSTAPSSLPIVGTPHEDSHLDREVMMAQAYGEIYSHKGFTVENGGTDSIVRDRPRLPADWSPAYSPGAWSPTNSPQRSPGSQSPKPHSPVARRIHSPGTQSPRAHSPISESPKMHSPGTHSPRAHSPGMQSPRTHSPVNFPVIQEEIDSGSLVVQPGPTHSQIKTSVPSPISPSPVTPSPTAQSPTPSPTTRIEITPDQNDLHRVEEHSQHVHFKEEPAKSSDRLPSKYKKDRGGGKELRKRIHFQRQPSSSDGPERSLSMFNNDMDVLKSIIGHSVVHHNLGAHRGQKILCLDGGGVKGLIQIEMLRTMEQMTGKSIVELFDWVVGTSTGGILALGMIYGGLSLSELRCLYFEMKDTVFKQQSKIVSHTCDTKSLEELLIRMLGTEKRMDCIEKPKVLITAVDKTTNRLPLVFFNNCFENVENKSIRNELVWKVARYTSAAPVFFAECDNYVDGGVVANNPTTFALPEIQNFLTKKHGRGSLAAKISCVVSLGCGIYPPEPLGNTDFVEALKWTKIHRAPQRLGDLLTLLTTALGGSEEMSRLCRINCEHQGISYFRFSPEIGEDVATTEKDNRKLCEIIIRAKALFVENASQVKEMVKALGYSIQEDYLYHI